MKKIKCNKCNSELQIISSGPEDTGYWKNTRKRKITFLGVKMIKIKKPSCYKMILKCKKKDCEEVYIYKASSKKLIATRINTMAKKQRNNKICNKRLLKEAHYIPPIKEQETNDQNQKS